MDRSCLPEAIDLPIEMVSLLDQPTDTNFRCDVYHCDNFFCDITLCT